MPRGHGSVSGIGYEHGGIPFRSLGKRSRLGCHDLEKAGFSMDERLPAGSEVEGSGDRNFSASIPVQSHFSRLVSQPCPVHDPSGEHPRATPSGIQGIEGGFIPGDAEYILFPIEWNHFRKGKDESSLSPIPRSLSNKRRRGMGLVFTRVRI